MKNSFFQLQKYLSHKGVQQIFKTVFSSRTTGKNHKGKARKFCFTDSLEKMLVSIIFRNYVDGIDTVCAVMLFMVKLFWRFTMLSP